MRRTLSAAVLIAAAAGAAACYPNRLDTVDYDVVATLFDSSANFQATPPATTVTYYLLDQVVHLVPPGGTDNITRVFDSQILATIRSNMNQSGYNEVTDSTLADLQLLTAASTTDYQGYYWDYWCVSWYYYCPPYWGTYEFTVGSLFVAMRDNRVSGTGPEAVWMGIGNGLAGQGTTAARLTDAINDMFTQSPYISAN